MCAMGGGGQKLGAPVVLMLGNRVDSLDFTEADRRAKDLQAIHTHGAGHSRFVIMTSEARF